MTKFLIKKKLTLSTSKPSRLYADPLLAISLFRKGGSGYRKIKMSITVTELLNKLKKEKKKLNKDSDKKEMNENFESDAENSEILEIDDTITEVKSQEIEDFSEIYDMIENLTKQIEEIRKDVNQLKNQAKVKYYKETTEFKEQNKAYNDFFNIPETERIYKPVIKKEQIDPKNIKIVEQNTNKTRKRTDSKTRKRSVSKRKHFK